MKANELSCKDLMVGDWVQGNPCGQHCDRNNNTYYKIAVLDIGNHCWGYSVCGAIVELKYDDIFPIHLTPEILEKNGFIKSEEDPILMGGIGCAIIYGGYKRLDEDKFLNYADNIYPIKYVHELQHALRLCGIEKEIEL